MVAYVALQMGPSGSGKTSFLDVLAGRKTVGQVSGKTTFDGVSPTPGLLRRETGYVEQFDTLVDALTVSEMLLYTAQLKRSIKEGFAAKKEAVEHLIKKLGLESCR
jgi:ABC-type multidrug transport system ATPase subunit